jgi:hypothetical protein
MGSGILRPGGFAEAKRVPGFNIIVFSCQFLVFRLTTENKQLTTIPLAPLNSKDFRNSFGDDPFFIIWY